MDLVLMHNENNPLLEKNPFTRVYAMQLLLVLNKLELVGGEILQSLSEVLPGKWPVLASLSSTLLQVLSGTTTRTTVHTLVCKKALLFFFDTTGLLYYSYNCNFHLLYMFLCCWCSEKPWYE